MSDCETRSTWNAYGLALDRPLKSTNSSTLFSSPGSGSPGRNSARGPTSSPHVRRRNHDGRSSRCSSEWRRQRRCYRSISMPRPPAQSSPGPATAAPRPELARHALTGPLEGFERCSWNAALRAANRGGPPRRARPSSFGIVVGYVLEGQLRFAINNEPERIIPAGGTFLRSHWRPSLDQRRRARRADALSRVPGDPNGAPVVAPASQRRT